MGHDVQQVRAFEHPGEGRRRAKATPKGRQVDPTAAHEIELLLGDRPRQRDVLIEYLHLIQDKYHQISAAHLAALADAMKLSFAEVFETATFYAHFDVVKEGQPDIPLLTIRVCDSLTCAMLGGEKLLRELQDSAGPGIRVTRAPCVGRCDTAPVAEVGHNFVDHAGVASVLATAKAVTPMRMCPNTSTTTPMLPVAATSCCNAAFRRTCQGRSAEGALTTRRYVVSVAPAFPPDANGAPCSANLGRG